MSSDAPRQLTTLEILRRWAPLAASWMLMGLEMPLVTAIVARLADHDIHLAAYGGIVFPLALIIESPIIMMLAASTALSKDWFSYQKLYRIMMGISFLLTVLHIAIAFTPLYYIVIADIMGAHPAIVEPARIGLMIMTPWTWAIAFRRFQQGVLIRFDHSKIVTYGTMIRLAAMIVILGGGYALGNIQGIVVASTAIAVGVVLEAIYAGLKVRPVVQNQVKKAPAVSPALTNIEFARFYIPLAMTSFLTLIALPIGSAAINRMPDALHSLDVWPVVNGLVFLLGSTGLAYQEVVVTLLDRRGALPLLQKFAAGLSILTSGILFLVALTPLSTALFEGVMGLSPELANLSRIAVLLGGLRPAFMVMQHWFQGIILHSKRTKAITEAIAIALVVTSVALIVGVSLGNITGIYVGVAAFTLGTTVQIFWLWYRSRGIRKTHLTKSHDDELLEKSSIQIGDQVQE